MVNYWIRKMYRLRSRDWRRRLRLLDNRVIDVITVGRANSPDFRAHKAPHREAADESRQGKEQDSEYGDPARMRTQTIRSTAGKRLH